MCNFNHHLALSQNKEGQINWCKSCHNYLVMYKACAFACSKKELKRFKATLEDIPAESFNLEIGGEKHVLLKSNAAPVGFCLTEIQAIELFHLIEEAMQINEVFEIIYRHTPK